MPGCSSSPGGLGDSCDRGDDESCESGLVCASAGDGDDVCLRAFGGACDPVAEAAQCAPELVCAEVREGEHPYACFAPVRFVGTVFDAQSEAGIPDARVIALDQQSTAVTDVALTDADGAYTLEIPGVVRDADGRPLPESYTLRASAADYLTFPGGLRTALPINTSEAVEPTEEFGAWIIDIPLTDIALLTLPDDQRGNPTIAGHVVVDSGAGGVLVVAESEAGGFSALSDASGNFNIFNVPDGDYTVRGYAAGLQLTPVDLSVAGADVDGVDLTASDAPLGVISGTINIVNAPGGSATSVVLVVASTFDEVFVRGDVPRGLRTPQVGVPDVTGAWTIADVPDGDYVVLAAFEDDDLVRDPDPNIAGTQIVSVTMPDAESAREITLATSFKITEALAVDGPGATLPEAVTDPPTFMWADDSSEDYYTAVVFDSYGNVVWEDLQVPRVTGSPTVTLEYGGPALERGVYYQFRATSWREGGGDPGPISTTEDLRGVFFIE